VEPRGLAREGKGGLVGERGIGKWDSGVLKK